LCTVVILRRPDHDWPLILGANRDEMRDRAWLPPARHWPDRPEVVAGRDEAAGGSWLGLNDHGVVAAILNRPGTLGRAPFTRSRGELVLEALDHADAADAVAALGELDPTAYRAFNMMVADSRDAFWIRALGAALPRKVKVTPVPEGLSMLTAHDLNDDTSARQRAQWPRFGAAPPPDPAAGDFAAWEALLADETAVGGNQEAAMRFMTERGFGTTSSAILALPKPGVERHAIFRFAAAEPGAPLRFAAIPL
jgi:hypothetical protein